MQRRLRARCHESFTEMRLACFFSPVRPIQERVSARTASPAATGRSNEIAYRSSAKRSPEDRNLPRDEAVEGEQRPAGEKRHDGRRDPHPSGASPAATGIETKGPEGVNAPATVASRMPRTPASSPKRALHPLVWHEPLGEARHEKRHDDDQAEADQQSTAAAEALGQGGLHRPAGMRRARAHPSTASIISRLRSSPNAVKPPPLPRSRRIRPVRIRHRLGAWLRKQSWARRRRGRSPRSGSAS